jgi:periplasmic mercuric ion binding protein
MKSIRLFFTMTFILASASFALAQTTTETFAVSGNCGMCKSRIEKAAKEAGATDASWDQNKKTLTVSFSAEATNVAKIQQKVAEVGHDNAGFRATDEVYAKLHGCCKYDRATSSDATAESCCKEGKCGKDGKCKEGKSGKGKKCCKEGKEGASCGSAKAENGKSCCSKKS